MDRGIFSGLSVDMVHGCTEISLSSLNARVFKGGSGFADVAVRVGSLEQYRGGDGDGNMGCISYL